jgi:MerR family transcriptional regulator, light-induced transcriptional regulator
VSRETPVEYPIRAVARMTGLSIDTLRAWERRYEAVVPRRSDRGRLYSESDVNRLRQLGELVGRGHAIGTIARLPNAAIGRLLQGTDRLSAVRSAPAPTANLAALTSALERYDLDAIETALNGYALVLPPRDLVFGVVVPLLNQIGERWAAGTLGPAQEHLVSAIVRSVLGGLLRATVRPQATPKVVFATPPGERHELGLLCAALLTASESYGVVYLGAELPAADIWDATSRSGARIVVLSLTMPGAVARSELRQLADPPPGVELWVGGSAAQNLLALSGTRGRHIDGIDAITRMLSNHER